MKYFLDTEFADYSENNIPIIFPISLALVCEDGRELYFALQNNENYFPTWHKENVFPNIDIAKLDYKEPHRAFENIDYFLQLDPNPIFYGWYSAYDWVVFCQLYGGMTNMPKNYPKHCVDLKVIVNMLENPKIPIEKSNKHNALEDARWIRDTYLWINKNYRFEVLKFNTGYIEDTVIEI